MRSHTLLAVSLLLALPTAAPALAAPIGISLESAVSRPSGGAAGRITVVTSTWLAGDVEAEARLGFESAVRPIGRGADAATSALGLRWSPDVGRWRPLLGVEAGVRLPTAERAVAPTAALRAGVEWRARRELWLSLAGGCRWSSGGGPAAEAVLGLGYAL
jgi:hypothetical protein